MKYKRLTSTYTTGDGEKTSGYINPRTYAVHASETIFRLAELEDKIERGELISTVQSEQGDQEIAFFVAHNAAVRKQAVKEFAETCKEKFSYAGGTKPFRFYVCSEQGIDEIVKEVCGE